MKASPSLGEGWGEALISSPLYTHVYRRLFWSVILLLPLSLYKKTIAINKPKLVSLTTKQTIDNFTFHTASFTVLTPSPRSPPGIVAGA